MRLCYFIFASLLTMLVSCDCVVHENGIVRDSSTHHPLSDVTITFDNKTYKTDKSGQYSIEYVTGFCPDRHLTFEKDGFKKFQIRIERSGKEISYHVTDKSEFIKYDQPMYLDTTKRSFTIGEWIELNSTNFGVKNDTLIIYLDKGN